MDQEIKESSDSEEDSLLELFQDQLKKLEDAFASAENDCQDSIDKKLDMLGAIQAIHRKIWFNGEDDKPNDYCLWIFDGDLGWVWKENNDHFRNRLEEGIMDD